MLDEDFKDDVVIPQEINLYSLLPKKTGMYLTKGVVISSYMVFFLLLMIFYFITSMDKNHLDIQLSQMTQQTITVQEQLTGLKSKYPVNDPLHLQDSLTDVTKQIKVISNEINLLSINGVFSSYLEALASSTVYGAWLSEITFTRGDNNIILKGFVSRRILLEQFLNNLSQQKIFKNLIFALQDLTETIAPASFTIITKPRDTL